MSLRRRVGLVAIGKEHVYSIGAVEVTAEGEVYFFSNGKYRTSKLSVHASTAMHVYLQNKERVDLEKMTMLAEFGIGFFCGIGLTLDTLPDTYNKWRGKSSKKWSDVFFIDMRDKGESTVMVQIGIFAGEGLNQFLSMASSRHEKFNYSVFSESNPKIVAIWKTQKIEKDSLGSITKK